MDHKNRKEGIDNERFGPQKLSYNEILEMELSKIKEYLELLTQPERTRVFASAKMAV